MLISQVWLLTQVFLLVWNQSNLMVGSGLSDQELTTDDELSGNENEGTNSDSSIDNNLDHLCTAKSAKSTELRTSKWKGESTEQYIYQLHKLIKCCGYGELKEEMFHCQCATVSTTSEEMNIRIKK